MSVSIEQRLGPVRYLAYDRMRKVDGAVAARVAFGLEARGRFPRDARTRRFVAQRVPENQPAVVRFVYEEVNRQRLSVAKVLRLAGLHEDALRDWRNKGTSPRLGDLEAVLGVLGYRLVAEKDGGS